MVLYRNYTPLLVPAAVIVPLEDVGIVRSGTRRNVQRLSGKTVDYPVIAVNSFYLPFLIRVSIIIPLTDIPAV